MPAAATMAQTFYTPGEGEFVSDFITHHTRRANWKRQSVAVLLLSADWRHIALALPRKVLERERENRIRVPIQGRLTGRTKNPLDDARLILRNKADIFMRTDALSYLGFGYTRSFRDHDTVLQYNKMLHFVMASLPQLQRLPNATAYAAHLEWYPIDSVTAIAEASMDERKAWLFLRALERVAAKHTPTAPRLRSALSL